MKLTRQIIARYFGKELELEDQWITKEQIASICPSCAERMETMGISKISAEAVLNSETLAEAVIVRMAKVPGAKGWEGLPKGWSKESLKSFWNSVGGSFTKCKEKAESAEGITNPDAFCAALKDMIKKKEWRGKKD